MTPKGTPDPEYPTSSSRKGDRKDKINLIDVWLKAKPVRLILYSFLRLKNLSFQPLSTFSSVLGFFIRLNIMLSEIATLNPHLSLNFYQFLFQKKKSHYVWHKKDFDEINVKTTDRLMGGY